MTNDEKRAALHNLLDLVLDINGFEARRQEKTGDKPTLFFYFSGHVSKIKIDVFERGWREGARANYCTLAYLENDGADLVRVIKQMEELRQQME